MTTLGHYQGMGEILQRLDDVRARRWTVQFLTAMMAVVAIAATTVLVLTAALGYWPDQPPAAVRWALVALACATIAGAVGFYALRVLLMRSNAAQTARFVEEALPQARNDLINSVLLSCDRAQSSPELVAHAIEEAARRSRKIDLLQSVSTQTMNRWGAAAAISVVLLTAFAIFQWPRFTRGLAGVSPRTYLPTVNALELISLTPCDTRIFAGETVTVSATVRNDNADPLKAEVLIRGHESTPRPMISEAGNASFHYTFPALEQTTEYAVRIGPRDRWPTDKAFYTITVIKRVKIQSMDLRYDYPGYTGLPAHEANEVSDGSVEAPMGTQVTVRIRVSDPVPAAALEFREGVATPMQASSDGMTFEGKILVDKDAAYRIAIRDESGHTLQQLPDIAEGERLADTSGENGRTLMKGYYRVHALPDDPPKIEFVVPNRDIAAGPGSKVDTKVKLYDKYGLTAAAFFAGKEGQEPQQLHAYDLAGKKEGVFDFAYQLQGYGEGDVVVYYATVTDNRQLPGLGPQTVTSSKYKIMLQDPAKVAAETAKRHEEIQKELMAILRIQETQRVNTGVCQTKTEVKPITVLGATIDTGQKEIKSRLLKLAEGQFDEETVPIQQAVALLANNEAQLAIDQSQVLETLGSLDDRDKSCTLLAGTQDKIIEALQMLLAIMPTLNNKALGDKKKAQGAELPDDVKDKLKALDEALRKFIEEQKKAIDSSKSLAKKPVDTFTPEDEKLLKDLQAIEDKWDKFINEAVTDFSKLAQQDFSNPQMMKELLSVKSDVTMAKDALKQKAAEMATACEDNGVENAKSLTANIEKWLPDTPDRAQWKMEDPKDDMNINAEQPNLPSELEDLVGDLLEQEEDLFDEMDDQTSKYAQSGDKGIGWDAMDGPISNMNAQGVTGNQLPNTNELSGRSGEGRQGKSSGEFVEDKAVGKGGRRTPTRLTPEPFQKGQIDDKSTEPPGGSTGGGKISGSGKEGLEGPLPPPVEKEMQRLAGNQADLISKGKKFLDNYKQSDYKSFQFLKAITLMSQVEEDMANHRYTNALRQKEQVVDSLKQTRLSIEGGIDVQKDVSAGMPKYIKENIADAMKGKLPEEFKDVLEQYYRRLGEQGAN